MTKRVDNVEGQLMSIRSSQKTKAYQEVDYQSNELKNEILKEVDQKITALETRSTHQMNEDCWTTAIHLQEISDLVTTVKDGEQKCRELWRGSVEISRS